MDHFEFRNGVLYAEEVPVAEIADRFGTPSFVYSRATLESHYRAFDEALAGLDHRVCYAVKANSNLAVLDIFARMGSSFDIVSGGELARLQAIGVSGDRIVFSGLAKTRDEIAAALRHGIKSINVESTPELYRVNEVAEQLGQRAPISLRINPDVDPKTHPYISTGLKNNKFGIAMEDALDAYRLAADLPYLDVQGLDCHIGSQLTELSPYMAALERLQILLGRIRDIGIDIHHLDVGGGLGIRYKDETPPSPAEWGSALREGLSGQNLEVLIEPGRAIAGNAGILLTKVEFLKPGPHKNFAVVDASMTELMRPALYNAWHEVVAVQPRTDTAEVIWDIVGPVCESGDWLAKDRAFALEAGDLLAVRSAGAYAAVMSSHYNTRPRVAELLVDGDQVHVAREREEMSAIWRNEKRLPEA